MLTQEENLVLQTYYTASLIAELEKNDFLGSDFFEKMTFSHHPIKDEIKKIGVNNQGTLLIYLYALLVVPKEITKSKYKKDQDILNTLVQSRALRVHTTYSSDQLGVDFFRHIRNAIAHLRVEFGPGETVTFKDFFHGDEFEVVFPLSHIGEFLTELQRIHRSYVCDIRGRVESD